MPGVRLPAEDPDDLKKVNDFIRDTEGAFSQVVSLSCILNIFVS